MNEQTRAPADEGTTAPDARAETPVAQVPRTRTLIGPFTARQIGLLNAVAFGVALLLFLVTRPIGPSAPSANVAPGATFYQISTATEGLQPGQTAPELEGDLAGQVFLGIRLSPGQHVTLTDLDGQPVRLADLRGRPVWINFWATWCPPCQHETPVLRDAYEAHRAEGLVLLAIDIQEDPETVRQYASTYGLTYRIGLDVTGAVFHTYRVFGLPTHYFIDRDGIIRGRYYGPLTREQVEEQLKAILHQ